MFSYLSIFSWVQYFSRARGGAIFELFFVKMDAKTFWPKHVKNLKTGQKNHFNFTHEGSVLKLHLMMNGFKAHTCLSQTTVVGHGMLEGVSKRNLEYTPRAKT